VAEFWNRVKTRKPEFRIAILGLRKVSWNKACCNVNGIKVTHVRIERRALVSAVNFGL